MDLTTWYATNVVLSSDGPQPHFITVEFPRKVAVQVSLSGSVLLHASHLVVLRNSAYISATLKMIPILRLRWLFVLGRALVTSKTFVSSL